MRGRKDSKSSTCTENAEVYAAGISGKVEALTRGGLTACRPERGDTEHRKVWPEPSEVSRGHSRPARRGRRPEHGAGVGA